MSALVLKNVHILDPGHLDMPGDATLNNGKIVKITLAGMRREYPAGASIIDASGLLLVPGLIDMHTHLRDPGQTHKESISTGAAAAVKGGFTTICCMANTSPVNDNPDTSEYILHQARRTGLCHVLPYSAVTRGLMGQDLVDFEEMCKIGVIGFSDDGVPVIHSDMMVAALKQAAHYKMPLISHCEDVHLARNKVIIRAGALAEQLGVEGVPAATETIMVIRDLYLAEIAESPIHIAHVSTRQSVEAIRQAKSRGVKVTAETAPHYFTLTTEALLQHGANAKMNPPLGSEADRVAVIQGLADGTIDVIATDHAPHSIEEKNQPLAYAPNGIVGLETALPLSLALVKQNQLSLSKVIAALTRSPARILGIESGIHEGAPANLTLINLNHNYTIKAAEFASKSRNTPFEGLQVTGAPVMTIVDGQIVWQNKQALTA